MASDGAYDQCRKRTLPLKEARPCRVATSVPFEMEACDGSACTENSAAFHLLPWTSRFWALRRPVICGACIEPRTVAFKVADPETGAPALGLELNDAASAASWWRSLAIAFICRLEFLLTSPFAVTFADGMATFVSRRVSAPRRPS